MSQDSKSPRANCASCNIDVERLIELVKKHPTLWDRTAENYSNKLIREHIWRTISSQLNEGYHKMDRTQKYAYVKLNVKKWNQLRDSWIRDVRKRRHRSRSGLPQRRYKYYKQLSFLNKVAGISSAVANIKTEQEDEEEEEDDDEETPYEGQHLEVTDDSIDDNIAIVTSDDFEAKGNRSKESRARESADPLIFMNDVQHEDVVPAYVQDDNDPHLHFFKGLLPITATLNVDETLEFQSGVIGLLQRIKKQRRADQYQTPETSVL